jgi:hypothetical protein
MGDFSFGKSEAGGVVIMKTDNAAACKDIIKERGRDY